MGPTANPLVHFDNSAELVSPLLEFGLFAFATLTVTVFLVNEELVLLELTAGTAECFPFHFYPAYAIILHDTHGNNSSPRYCSNHCRLVPVGKALPM